MLTMSGGTPGWRMAAGSPPSLRPSMSSPTVSLLTGLRQRRTDPSAAPWITDSVLPIVAAKRDEVVKSDYQFSDIVKLLPTPGHTIDHYSVQVGRPGADAVITGDMIHSPLQARYPELGMRVDYSSPQAGESRRKLFSCLCDTSTLICTAHFPSPPPVGCSVGARASSLSRCSE